VLPAPFVNASGFAFGCLLPVRVCGERVGHGGLDSERLGEPGELEDAQDARSADCQSERSTGLAEPFDTADGLGPPVEHALISLLALNGLRVSEATGADIEHLGLDRGHRTLTITRKGGKVVTVPLAPRTARAIDLAVGERTDGPVFLAADRRRLDRHGAGRIVRKTARRAGIAKTVTPHTLRSSPPRLTLGSRCATSKKPPLMQIREPPCGMTGPAAAWTGMQPTSSPPTSRAPPGNGTPTGAASPGCGSGQAKLPT